MIQVTICWLLQFQIIVTNFIKCFIVKNHGLLSSINQLMQGKHKIVWLDHAIWYPWWWNDWVSSVYLMTIEFCKKKRCKTRSCASSERVSYVVSMQSITSFSLLSQSIKNWFDEVSTFFIIAFGIAILCSCWSCQEAIWPKEFAIWSCFNCIQWLWVKICEHSSRYVFASWSVIEESLDSLKIILGLAIVNSNFI